MDALELRRRRRWLDLTHAELADRARCSVTTVQVLEGGWTPRKGRSRALDRILAVLDELKPAEAPETAKA